MPKFAYSAIDASGATVEGTTKAETIAAVRQFLTERSLYPVRIQESRSGLNIELTKGRLKKRELMHFSRQLAVFVKAGIPLVDALDTINSEAQDGVLRKVLTDMSERLRAGETFVAAAAAHPEAFPPFYLGVLQSAELTGNIDETLDSLADYVDRDIQARQKVVSALAYPMVVVLMAVGTLVVLAGYVLPQFKVLFADLGTELPLPTRMLLGVSTLFTTLWFIPFSFFALAGAAVVWMRRTPAGNAVRDRLLLRLPAIKGIVEYSILERFCRVMATMTGAGVPIPEALRVTAEATNNTVYRTKLEEARQQMVDGAGLSRPLIATGLFPGAARQMFTVGEETGTLDKQLETAADYFDRELEVRIKRFTTIFEPVMIIAVGGMVGFVAVALMSAVYGILGGIQEGQ
jgi:type IV pilus assembly protein PilC